MLRQLAAHRVVDHIHALAAGELFHPGLQRLLGIVNAFGRPRRRGHLELFRRGRRSNHPGTHGPAQLHRRQPHAARSPQHQQGFARLQRRPLLQRVVGGAVGETEARRGDEIHLGRHGQQTRRRHRLLLGE